tara:strand:+ start:1203 stop:1541 length:339 start_codon:yes stop_codon:yes gene_type:complete
VPSVVANTNVGLSVTSNSIAEACECQESTNISLKSLCDGSTSDGIRNTFGSGGGSANDFEKLGGSNNPISGFSSGDTDITTAAATLIGNAPYKMSNCIGGQHVAGGGGGGGR